MKYDHRITGQVVGRMRNSIAHGKAYDNADAVAFLDGHPYKW